MCFYNDDYDWSADVCVETAWPMGQRTRCDECNAEILPNEWRHVVHMEESESCKECGYYPGDPADESDSEEPCEHCYGETFDYVRCSACDKILRAIEAHEIDEGCPPGSRRPALTGLSEAFYENENESADAYRERARTMFPEIAGHKFLTGVEA